MPAISVIIPAHNQGHYLGKAISSVLGQTYQDFEIIVVDDGSTDNTCEVVGSFSDKRILYVYQKNRGLSSARNTGIRHARGAFLTYLDSDDLFGPEKLQLLVEAFDAKPELGLVAGEAVLIDEEGRLLGEIFDKEPPADCSQLLLGNPLHVGSVLLRREWQEQVGFFDESLRSYEDWDMWLRLGWAGCQMGWVPKPVSFYRFHREQMTRNGDQMTQATFAVLDKVFRNPDLPQEWRALHDQAYGRAYLRAAAQAYTKKDFSQAPEYMSQAVRLSPDLLANNAERLARVVAGWANHVKTREPLIFLEGIYDHLPAVLELLRRRRHQDLAREAMQLAFAASRRGDDIAVRSAVLHAISYQPRRLVDKGALSILVHSWMKSAKRGLRLQNVKQ